MASLLILSDVFNSTIGVYYMSDPENKDNGILSKNLKIFLWIVAGVALWVMLQSLIGVPMKM